MSDVLARVLEQRMGAIEIACVCCPMPDGTMGVWPKDTPEDFVENEILPYVRDHPGVFDRSKRVRIGGRMVHFVTDPP